MDNLFDSYQFFLCKITLKKYNFIGINYKSIVMLITSDNKILLVKFNENKIDKSFPFKKLDTFDPSILKKWVIDNGYNFEFKTKSKNLKIQMTVVEDNIVSERVKPQSLISKYFNLFKS